MTATTILCNASWEIIAFMSEEREPGLREGDCLRDAVREAGELPIIGGARCRMKLTFTGRDGAATCANALVKPFSKGFLVVLTFGDALDSGLKVAELYEDAIGWARDHLDSIFRDEYYHIHLLNNQLIDSKRALARSNSRLRQTLDELEEANAELERAHKMTEEALELAERANNSKTAFLASVSHDIRTPLNAITGLIELIEHDGGLSEKQEGYLGKMRSSSSHLLGIINDVLDISRIESGNLTLSQESLLVAEQIEQVEIIISSRAAAKSQQFTVDTSGLSRKRLIGDSVRLRQVLTNLLSNAVKYTPEGGRIMLRAQDVPCEREGYTGLAIEVADNGCGMAPEFAKRVFDPFTREKSVKTIQGTGLGMAITKNIVTLMGGTIDVTSALGEGSTFTVTLELPVDASANASKAGGTATGSADAKGESAVSLSGLRLLAAEDNELNAEILDAMLSMKGASCTICPNGRELVDAFAASTPGAYDAILMDVQMPVMDGYTAARAVRALERSDATEIPIIAMTANAFSEDARKCLDAGMDAHLAKPLDMDKLASTIARLAGQDA